MELKKYERLFETLQDWDKEKSHYGFEIQFETIAEPGHVKIATAKRISGADSFKEKMQRLFENKDVATVTVKLFSGINGKARLQSVETIRVHQKPDVPIVNYNVPEKSVRRSEPTNQNQHIHAMPPQEPQPQPQPTVGGLDGFGLLMGVLGIDAGKSGLGGLNGTETLQNMLNFRDNILHTKMSISEKDKEIAELKNKVMQLEQKVETLNGELDVLEGENEKLNEELSGIQSENEQLQKYKPENSLLGVSLTSLGGAILERAAMNFVRKKPDLVGGLLGIDGQTLLGMLDEPTETATQTDVPEVEISGINETPERKTELAVIAKITDWLKSIERIDLAMIEAMVHVWSEDSELIKLTYDWAIGNKNKKPETLRGEVEAETQED